MRRLSTKNGKSFFIFGGIYMWYVYILQCRDGRLYTGITNDTKRRFDEHKKGIPQHPRQFTGYNPAIKFLYKEIFSSKSHAAKREKQIKGWTRRKKLALINGDLALLKKL